MWDWKNHAPIKESRFPPCIHMEGGHSKKGTRYAWYGMGNIFGKDPQATIDFRENTRTFEEGKLSKLVLESEKKKIQRVYGREWGLCSGKEKGNSERDEGSGFWGENTKKEEKFFLEKKFWACERVDMEHSGSERMMSQLHRSWSKGEESSPFGCFWYQKKHHLHLERKCTNRPAPHLHLHHSATPSWPSPWPPLTIHETTLHHHDCHCQKSHSPNHHVVATTLPYHY